LQGRVVGINIARAGRTESFAIPTSEILPLLEEFKAGKFAVKKDPVPPDAVVGPPAELDPASK
jgi:hypothetical protein